jgi:hypothetical protein
MKNMWFKVATMHDPNQSGLPCMSAFVGGIVAQEIVKAITQKFIPIKQLALFSCSELIEGIIEDKEYSSLDHESV